MGYRLWRPVSFPIEVEFTLPAVAMKPLTLSALLVLWTPMGFSQGGDDCSSAIPLVGETYLGMDSFSYTDSGFASGGSCSLAAGTFIRDQFFQWSPAEPGDYSFVAVSSLSGNFDIQLALHSGIGCGATCVEVADTPNMPNAILHLSDVDPADDFLLQFGGWYTSPSTTSPSLRIIKVEGDTCQKAIPIAGSGEHEFIAYPLSASGFSGAQPCGGTAPAVQDKFYRWTAEATGDYWFDTLGSAVDAWVTVFDGPDCGAGCLGVGGPTPQGRTGSVRIPGVQAGQELLVQVSVDWDIRFVGDQSLTIYRDLCSIPDPFEPNDAIATAFPIADGSYADLSVNGGSDLADFFKFRLEPGESVFADHTSTNGAPCFLAAYDASGTRFSTYYASDSVPYYTNTFPWASDFYISVRKGNGQQFDCAGYDLDFRIGADPCNTGLGDPLGENDTCATAVPIGPGLYPNQQVSMTDADYFRVTVAPGETFRANLTSSESLANLYVRLLEPCSGPTLAYGDRTGVQWTNHGAALQDAVLEIAYASPGHYINRCVEYHMAISGGVALGTQYCAPTQPNSVGAFPGLQAIGSPVASENLLTLVADGVPTLSFGYFLGSQTQGFVVQAGGSEGTLCLGGSVARFLSLVGQAVDGRFVRTIDLSNVPEPSQFQTTVVAGQTWNFQLWYRDSINGSNTSHFSGATSITYQ